MSLEGKVALVTGGGTGIGKEIARVLHAAGARVVITGRREEVLQKTVDQLGEGFGFVAGDVGEEADAERMVESCVAQFGSCDILINNAGIVSAYGKFSEVDVGAFDAVIKTNLRGTFLVSRAAIRQMIKQGRGGSIVNNSSCCGLAAWRHLGAYGASKGGINTMTQVMAVDHGADGIRVNGKCPAFELLSVAVADVLSLAAGNNQPISLVPHALMALQCLRTAIAPGTVNTDDDATAESLATHPLASIYPSGRIGNVADIGHAVLLLCADEGSWINGAILPVDGGLMAYCRM